MIETSYNLNIPTYFYMFRVSKMIKMLNIISVTH